MAQIIEKRIQWNSLKTFKFTVNYKAFQPEVSDKKTILLRQLSQKTMLLSFKVHPVVRFNNANITQALLTIKWGINGTPFTALESRIGQIDLQNKLKSTRGLFQAMPQFFNGNAVDPKPRYFNHDAATDIFLKLKVGPGESINDLNKGDFEIWLTTIRNV